MDGEAGRAQVGDQCQAQPAALGGVPQRLVIHPQIKGAGLVGEVGSGSQYAKDKGIQADEKKENSGRQR